MDIIEVINIINNTYEDVYQKFKNGFVYPKAETTFACGYCFEYHNLLKKFFPDAVLVMQNDKMHCATLIDDNIYDVNGIRYDYNNFHVATGSDIEYIYKYYAFFNGAFKQNLNKLVTQNVFTRKNDYSKKLYRKEKV